MRLKLTASLTIIIAITLQYLSATTIVQCEEVKIHVNRIIEVKTNYASTTDEITVISGRLGNLTYYLNKQYEDKLYNIKAEDEDGKEIPYRIIESEEQIQIQFTLNQTRTPYKFKVKIYWVKIFVSFITFIRVKLPLYPTIPIPIDQFQAKAILSLEARNITKVSPNATKQFNGKWTIKFNKTMLPEMTSRDVILDFTGEIQHIIGRSITREIHLDGKIQVKETIIFENIGYTRITTTNGINFTLPPKAIIAKVEDDFGEITYSVYSNENTTIVHIKPRINIGEKWKYRVIIQYWLEKSQWINENEEKEFIIPTKHYYNMAIDSFKIIVYLPEKSKLISISGEKPSQIDENRIIYEKERVVEEMSIGQSKIIYTPPPTTYTIPTNILVGAAIGAIIGTAIFIRGYIFKPRKSEEKTSEITMKIDELNDAIQEKIETLLSLRELEETLRRKKISRKAHKVRVRELRSELRKIDLKVATIKNELKTKNVKIKTIIEEIDEIERELTNLIMKAIQNERQLTLKRINRATYEENRRKNEREIRKTRIKLESKMVELTEIVS